jgi:hypothetical protein
MGLRHGFLIALCAAGCAAGPRPYALRPILWEDPDQRPFSPAPEERDPQEDADAFDHELFRPLSEMWAFEAPREAMNVNALDEVPSSSWFVNRIGRSAMTPEGIARGACGEEAFEAPGPWTITGGKPADSASPGFFIQDANGVRYLMKTDRADQPEQGTAADAIVAAVLHAAGYWVPCNRVVFFDPAILEIEEGADAPARGNERTPIDDAFVARVLGSARTADGRHRAMLSRFVDGKPLGPWSYMGTREGDLNDVVPHEHRRDLRGLYVLFAWVNHFDARQMNTLSSWIETESGEGHVRHYLLDFGDALGHIEAPLRRGARNGHTLWIDPGDILADTLSVGILPRPWDGREPHPVLGYLDVEHFDADRWRPHYWNGALDRRTEADDAWMARILARFGHAHVRALVELGRYSDPEVATLLWRTLMQRRELLLERYFERLSPLADPVVTGDRVCVRDLPVTARIRSAGLRRYAAVLEGDETPLSVEREGRDRACIALPASSGYHVVEVTAWTDDETPPGPLRVHVVLDRDRAHIVGLERPSSRG